MAKQKSIRKKYRKPGSMKRVRLSLWRTVRQIEGLLDDPDASTDEIVRLTHALTQATAVYVKVHEAYDLERRLAKLEERLAGDLLL